MSPKQDFVSAKASTKPWSHLRGVEEISLEVRSLSAYEGDGMAAANLNAIVLMIMVLEFTDLHYAFEQAVLLSV